MTDRDLILRAAAAMDNAYSPYSGLPVGAAIECEGGEVFTGCSVENASFSASICAERAAVCAAVGAGCMRFRRIAIVSKSRDYTYPCGTCRQVLAEFSPNMEVLCVRADGRYVSYSLEKLMPLVFDASQLNVFEPRKAETQP
ncbi:MAG: cytidine deaminase [Oscillospiraceae bacterium]|nr:cytidine deaminase [Oscillospiraceae bacterium]